MTTRTPPLCIALLSTILGASARAVPPDPLQPVGPAPDGSIKVPNSQIVRPVGQVLAYPGRPLDLCLSTDGATAYVKNTLGVDVISTRDWRMIQSIKYEADSGSMHGIVLRRDEATKQQKLYVTGSHRHLMEANVGVNGQLTWSRNIALPGPNNENSHATGLAISKDGSHAYVCLSRNNTLAVVDLANGTLLHEIPVGVCPYDVILSPDDSTAYVTNFGGRRPATTDKTAKSTGTNVAIEPRGIALSGTISKVDLPRRAVAAEIAVGLHPAQILMSSNRLYVANANSDSVSVIDAATDKVIETIPVRPDDKLPFGCVVNALALSPDGRRLFCANAGNNAIAVVDLATAGAKSEVRGFIPTGWFPGAIACDGANLYIANVKGEGSRTPSAKAEGWASRDVRGSVQKVPFPTPGQLAAYTAQAKADAMVPQALRAMEQSSSATPPAVVPRHIGEPGVIHHVIYVIKENRTYDQVFGDIPRANGDPKLCVYGNDVTPNHHALAERFGVLDNYYCNGVLSADGHQWATQGMVTDYQEKAFGGHTRSYDFGTDALTYANCDFLWDSVLLHGLSFRNYGEFDFPSLGGKPPWFDVYRDWKARGALPFRQSIEVDMLKKYSSPIYPGWNLRIPDVYRMEQFRKEFADFEKSGSFPNLVIVYLPQDHTEGTSQAVPTPRAHVADNDLALGQLVETISHSRFWPDSCIFVNEDDPQNGFDHVDGHRSLCLVISPYSKRGAVVSHFYNQTAVLHTITQMLGLPPMNQMVALAPTMEDCFTDKPDLKPYTCLPNVIALDERNKAPEAMTPKQKKLHDEVARSDFSKPDRVDDDDLNRLLWFAERATAYPAEFEGAHGKGLAALKLKLDPTAPKERD